VHRDIKPANIGVDSDRAVIFDLRESRKLEADLLVASVCGTAGTIGYLPPEMESGRHDTAIDI
jgi:serine/threonine protein kinase